MIKLLELFGGIGAPRKAMENLGVRFESVDYVEINKHAVDAYNVMYGESYEQQDITTWTIDSDTHVDILVHGSPCLDFSKNGLNDLSKGRSILYTRTLEIIGDILVNKPKVVLWENVANLASKRHKEHLDYYLDTMESFGYKNYYKILNAKEYGIPQSRERLYTVSILNANKEFVFPDPVEAKSDISNYIDRETDFDTLKLSANEQGVLFWNDGILCAREATKLGYKQVDEYDTINVEFPNSKTRRGRVGKRVSSTLTTHPRQAIYYDGKIRLLSAKEHLRLMGFDDGDFDKLKEIGKSDNQISHLAGNSICVPVLMEIYKKLFELNLF